MGMMAAALVAAAGTAFGAAPGVGEGGLHAEHAGLPFFDVRQTAGEAPSAAVERALDRHKASESWKRREARRAELMREIPELRCDADPFFGTPHFLRSTAQMLTGPSQNGPQAVVRDYVQANRDLFEIDAKELEQALVARDFSTHGIMHHLTFQQAIGGVELFGCIMRTSVTTSGQLINVSSAMIPSPDGGWNLPAENVNAEQALRAAAANAGVTVSSPLIAGEAEGADAKTTWTVGEEFDHWLPVVTRKVYFPLTREEVHPAWHVTVPTKGIGHTYTMVVDAVDGRVLWRRNLLRSDTTQPVTYRVYTSDSPAPGSPGTATPSGAQFPFVPRQLVTIPPATLTLVSPNGWIPDGGSTTSGNNVDAYLDADGTPNTPDVGGRPVSGARVFDFAIAVDGANMPTGAPSTYSMASVTQGFYLANLYHDRLWTLGFDEPAGNFQSDNFGRGGLGADYVRMEMQDAGGTNNANFATPADGSLPRCQMYRFTATTPDRDGGLDADIVYHELTHGTSNRCHELTLSGTQADSMGEGWGDFFAICLNAESGDDMNGVYTVGAHTTFLLWDPGFNTNYYYGIRRFPYSTDENKNPQTFADIDPAQQAYPPGVPRNTLVPNSASEVHNAGEIWANALLECRAVIAQDEGFAANNTTMQVVLDGMKLAPSNPNYLQERDAIIQSDLVRYGGAHYGRLWQGFADSGMGWSATSPVGGSTSGVVEAFDVPAPANNSCANALVYAPGASTSGTTASATNDGSAGCGLSTTAPDVWFQMFATCTGRLRVDTCGSSFDTVLSVHPACPGTSANQIACNDDHGSGVGGCGGIRDSALEFNAVGGTTYLIRVSGYNGASGAFSLNSEYVSVGSDDCAGAPSVADGSYVFNNCAATTDGPQEQNCSFCCGDLLVNNDLWFRYTAPVTGTVTVDTCGSGAPTFDTKLAVYAGSCPTLPNTAIACNDDVGSGCGSSTVLSRASFDSVLGQQYLIRVGGFGSARGTGTLTISSVSGNPCDADVNCDGSVNGFDIEATEQAVNGDFSNFCQATADLNGDGAENGFDIETEEQRVNGAPC